MSSRLTALCAALVLAACTFPEYDYDPTGQVGGSPSGASPSGGTAASDGGDGGLAATGNGGSSTAPACEPGDSDVRCDGLDASCNRTATDTACPDNCTPEIIGDHTYMRCGPPSLTFDQAESRCEVYGMHLAVIEDAAENELLIKRKTDPYIWIGGISAEEGVFQWVTGTVFYDNGSVPGVYQNFATGGPDSDDKTLRCVQFESGGLWSAAHCTDTQAYICEL